MATPAIAAAQKETSTIPIIMDPATDPIGSGFVKTFAHPGGNITGVANMFGDLTAKSLEVLHTILPAATKIAVQLSSNPTHPGIYKTARDAGASLKLTTVPITALAPADLPRAFQDMAKMHCDALFVLADPIRPEILPLAAEIKIPALYQYSEWADAGGFVSYGPSVMSMVRKAAQYVARIFNGESPADVPVEQPTTFELVLNLKTAKSLALSIPDSILLRADRLVQ